MVGLLETPSHPDLIFRPLKRSVHLGIDRALQEVVRWRRPVLTALFWYPSPPEPGWFFLVSRGAFKLAQFATPPESPAAFRTPGSAFQKLPGLHRGVMDRNDGRQRQNHSGYANQQGTSLGQYPLGHPSDRFRQQPLASNTPLSTPAPAGPRGAQPYGYDYDADSQFAGNMPQPYGQQQYSSGPPAPQRTPQTQYSQYGSSQMYHVPGPQGDASSQYGTVSQYQQSQEPAIETMNGGYRNVTQSQYYGAGGGQEGAATAPAVPIAPQPMPSQYQAQQLGYPSHPSPGARESSAFSAASMADPRQVNTPQGVFATGTYQDANDSSTKAYSELAKRTTSIFSLVQAVRLDQAAEEMLQMTDWLASSAERLNLTQDPLDTTANQEKREQLSNFNNCFMAALQKQKDLLKARQSGQQLNPSHHLIDERRLSDMGDRIVSLCNGVEKHGMVDYELGIWEEEIISMLTDCLNLMQDAEVGHQQRQIAPIRRR